jgi:hypothetical protein
MTGTLEHLDPATRLIGDNVRDDAVLDKQYVASVRERVVLQPITAIRTDVGTEVRDGQIRTNRDTTGRRDYVRTGADDRRMGLGEHPRFHPGRTNTW